jgi:hypothetical protein
MLNSKTVKLLREEVNQHLQDTQFLSPELQELSFEFGNCTMSRSGDRATFKVEVLLKGGDTKEMSDLKTYATMYGLDLNNLKEHNLYELIGYRPRATKSPFIVRSKADNKEYIIAKTTALKFFKQDQQRPSIGE